MKAGRELDALIELTFKFNPRMNQHFYDKFIREHDSIDAKSNEYGLKNPVGHYSTNITDAWLVMDYFINQEWENETPKYLVDFEMVKDNYFVRIKENQLHGRSWEEEAEAMPLAICLSALKVVGVDID